MIERHRQSEQARFAARSVIANAEALGCLTADARTAVTFLAEQLCSGHLDQTETLVVAAQLSALLRPAPTLAARTFVSWLDDLCWVA